MRVFNVIIDMKSCAFQYNEEQLVNNAGKSAAIVKRIRVLLVSPTARFHLASPSTEIITEQSNLSLENCVMVTANNEPTFRLPYCYFAEGYSYHSFRISAR